MFWLSASPTLPPSNDFHASMLQLLLLLTIALSRFQPTQRPCNSQTVVGCFEIGDWSQLLDDKSSIVQLVSILSYQAPHPVCPTQCVATRWSSLCQSTLTTFVPCTAFKISQVVSSFRIFIRQPTILLHFPPWINTTSTFVNPMQLPWPRDVRGNTILITSRGGVPVPTSFRLLARLTGLTTSLDFTSLGLFCVSRLKRLLFHFSRAVHLVWFPHLHGSSLADATHSQRQVAPEECSWKHCCPDASFQHILLPSTERRPVSLTAASQQRSNSSQNWSKFHFFLNVQQAFSAQSTTDLLSHTRSSLRCPWYVTRVFIAFFRLRSFPRHCGFHTVMIGIKLHLCVLHLTQQL